MAHFQTTKYLLNPQGPNTGIAIVPVTHLPAPMVECALLHEGTRITALFTIEEAAQIGVSLIASAERARVDHGRPSPREPVSQGQLYPDSIRHS